jgi:hypothetical protein
MSEEDSPELVLVYTTGSIMDAYLVKGRLEVEGIAVLLQGGEGPYRVGPVSLFVTKEDETDARAILEAATVEDDTEEEPGVPSEVASPNGDQPPN